MADEIDPRLRIQRGEVGVEVYPLKGQHGFIIYSGDKKSGDYRAIFDSTPLFMSEALARMGAQTYINAVRALDPKALGGLEKTSGGNGRVVDAMREAAKRVSERP